MTTGQTKSYTVIKQLSVYNYLSDLYNITTVSDYEECISQYVGMMYTLAEDDIRTVPTALAKGILDKDPDLKLLRNNKTKTPYGHELDCYDLHHTIKMEAGVMSIGTAHPKERDGVPSYSSLYPIGSEESIIGAGICRVAISIVKNVTAELLKTAIHFLDEGYSASRISFDIANNDKLICGVINDISSLS